jgi:hypothetical protein
VGQDSILRPIFNRPVEVNMTIRCLAILFAFATLVPADTLTLRDGKTVEGNYAGGDTRTIRMMVGDALQTFQVADVAGLTFGSSSTSSAEPQPSAPPPDKPALVIPAGTEIVVRMVDAVNSETDRPGYTFRASVDEPLVIKGQTVCPKDADVIVKLVEEHESGKLTGKTSLTLAMQQLQVNGNMVDVKTEKVTKTSGSRGKKTAAVAGGGAALGAVVGALAGGGTGAAVGAASGGALGAGVEVMTSGQKVKIPSETRLTFTLESAVKL